MSQINSRDKVFLWRGEYQCGEIEDLVTGVWVKGVGVCATVL